MGDPESKVWTAQALDEELAPLKKADLFAFARRHGLMSSASAPSINVNDFKSMIVGAALRESRVHPEAASISDSTEDIRAIRTSIHDVSLKVDRLGSSLQTKLEDALKRAAAAEESANFISKKYDDLSNDVKQLKNTVAALQKIVSGQTSLPPTETDEQDAIVVSGLAEDAAEKEADLSSAVQQLFSDTMQLDADVNIVSVKRLGAPGKPTPRKTLVKLESKQQAAAVLKAAKSLREYNHKAKEERKQPIGIDRSLSGPQLKHRSSVWAAFKAAKSAGKTCRWFMGFRLFVDGIEVFPSGASST